MLQIDTASAEAIAEKIEELVHDRDFLGWSKQKSAANIIVRLVEKASDEVREEESLYEARELLHRLYPGDRQRKETAVREALTMLRRRRDRQGVVMTPESIGLQRQMVLPSSSRQRDVAGQTHVPSPFLEPQHGHHSLQG